jgi:hypothetical protein
MKISFNGAIWVQGSKMAFPPGSLRYDAAIDIISIWLKQEDLAVAYVLWSEVQNASGTTFGTKAEALAYLDVVFAAVGGEQSADLEAGEAIAAGMAVRCDAATTKFLLAQANSFNTAMIAGLAKTDASNGFIAQAARQSLSLPDWTASTGTALLVIGASYFLSASQAGKLTTIPPTVPGEVVCFIGQALNPTTLIIEISDPILL